MTRILAFILCFSVSAFCGVKPSAPVMPIPDSLYVLRDFQINENTGMGVAGQMAADVATNGESLGVVAWIDSRADASLKYDVYFQRYSKTEGLVGGNLRANENAGTVEMAGSSPVSVAMDPQGIFLIAWTEVRNGVNEVYAQFYSGQGEETGYNFRVNNNPLQGNEDPDVVYCPDGRFVIVWKGGKNIYAKIYSYNGAVLIQDFIISQFIPQDKESYYPAVALYDEENMIVSWLVREPGHDTSFYRVYAQRFSLDGALIGQCQQVNESFWPFYSTQPTISSDSNGNFIVAWKEYETRLFARFFGKDAQPKGSQLQIAPLNSTDFGPVGVSMDRQGYSVACWVDDSQGICAQRFTLNGEAIGGLIDVNPNIYIQNQEILPSITHFNNEDFIITWSNQRNNNFDIFLRLYNKDGIPIQASTQVSSDSGVTNQLFPSVATDGKDLWGVVWQDFRTGNPNRPHVFARFFDSKGTTIRSDFQVDDGGGSVEGYPDICMGGDGSILISWAEYRDNSTSIYARQYTSMTDTVGRLVRVNDKTEWSEFFSTRCTADSDGNFMAVWLGRYAGENGIYGRIFDKNLNPVCPEIKITDENLQLYYCNEPSAVISNSKGDFIVLWADGRNGEYNDDVFFQAVSRDGKKTGKNIKVNSDLLETRQNFPSAVIGPNDNLMVAWIDRLAVYGDTTRINIRRFGDDYLPKGKMTELLSANESMHPYFLRLVGDKKNGYFAAWIDDLTKRVYGRFFDSESGGRSPIFKMTDADQGTQAYPAAASTSDRIVLTWADNRTGTTAYDIWGNAVKWIKPAGGAADDTTVSGGDMEISRNFPNPFRRTSVIQYQLKNGAFVQLKVCNMLGRQVKTLIQQFQEAGRHEVVLNSSDFSSGVYFCQFLVDGRKVGVRKILIMK
jgi:hypothetical protein